MRPDNQAVPACKKMLWAGRIVAALPVLFLLVDGAMRLAKPEIVVKTTVGLGYAETIIRPLGIMLLACAILYLIPQTAVLGAILLTGYLGGAVAKQALRKRFIRNLVSSCPRHSALGWAGVTRGSLARACSVAELGRTAYRHQSPLII